MSRSVGARRSARPDARGFARRHLICSIVAITVLTRAIATLVLVVGCSSSVGPAVTPMGGAGGFTIPAAGP